MSQRVLVTGASKRLGALICYALAENGYDLCIHYRTSQKEAEEVKARCQEMGVDAEIVCGDLLSIDFRPIDHLINNVGVYTKESLLDYTLDEWKDCFEVNCFAPFALTKRFLPTLKSVINIGVSGLENSDKQRSLYRLTKKTLLHITKMLASELAPKGICVNMVSPGQLSISEDLPDNLGSLPMKRAVEPSEITQMILFLLKSPSITGQNIDISGGLGL
ncbi:MAG: SDR family oxidoreductase [Waddliaceae bacterium]